MGISGDEVGLGLKRRKRSPAKPERLQEEIFKRVGPWMQGPHKELGGMAKKEWVCIGFTEFLLCSISHKQGGSFVLDIFNKTSALLLNYIIL